LKCSKSKFFNAKNLERLKNGCHISILQIIVHRLVLKLFSHNVDYRCVTAAANAGTAIALAAKHENAFAADVRECREARTT
jgi:hypothetical protein